MLLAELHFKLLTGAHLLLMECQLHQLHFQQWVPSAFCVGHILFVKTKTKSSSTFAHL